MLSCSFIFRFHWKNEKGPLKGMWIFNEKRHVQSTKKAGTETDLFHLQWRNEKQSKYDPLSMSK
jgi:hypothetical protein